MTEKYRAKFEQATKEAVPQLRDLDINQLASLLSNMTLWIGAKEFRKFLPAFERR